MANTKGLPRVLPADVYDALELSALVHGGIGCYAFSEAAADFTGRVPCCVYGHADFLDGRPYGGPAEGAGGCRRALIEIALFTGENDRVVARVETKTGRISFKRWCKALNVARGQ